MYDRAIKVVKNAFGNLLNRIANNTMPGGGGGQPITQKSCERLDCQNNGKNCDNVSNKDNTAIVGKNLISNESLLSDKNLNLKPPIVIARKTESDEAIHPTPKQHTFKLLRRLMDCRALRARNDECGTSGSTQRQKCTRNDGKSSRGGVLVEFAIGAPILITIMLYGHDIFKIARMHERMEFAAHCAVNMIQNTNRAITAADIRRISYAWQMIIYPNPSGKMVQLTSRRCITESDLFFVVGTGDNKCKVMWSARSGTSNGSSNPNNYSYTQTSNAGAILTEAHSSIFCNISGHSGRIKTEIPSTTLYPGFTIKTEEKKIIFEIRYYIWDSGLDPREAFGLRLLTPSPTRKTNYDGRSFFTTIVIFTPKPGLFSETVPN